ncbi:hypothetical protein BD626DRAFT_128867 [Schizophyllum amplum]|uniref:Uncharacterized protein n=1 Tax=Schizophyllum amplum TaxID=97359 RepID=A0A550BRU1_9AGAR|nr:hypothetical protein BD626DRAFT_128867 [Auriculariopsis ampla]
MTSFLPGPCVMRPPDGDTIQDDASLSPLVRLLSFPTMFAVVLSAAPPRSVGPAAYMKVDEQPTDDAVTDVPLAGHTRCHVHAAPRRRAWAPRRASLSRAQRERIYPGSGRSPAYGRRTHAHGDALFVFMRMLVTTSNGLHRTALRLHARAGRHATRRGKSARRCFTVRCAM